MVRCGRVMVLGHRCQPGCVALLRRSGLCCTRQCGGSLALRGMAPRHERLAWAGLPPSARATPAGSDHRQPWASGAHNGRPSLSTADLVSAAQASRRRPKRLARAERPWRGHSEDGPRRGLTVPRLQVKFKAASEQRRARRPTSDVCATTRNRTGTDPGHGSSSLTSRTCDVPRGLGSMRTARRSTV